MLRNIMSFTTKRCKSLLILLKISQLFPDIHITVHYVWHVFKFTITQIIEIDKDKLYAQKVQSSLLESNIIITYYFKFPFTAFSTSITFNYNVNVIGILDKQSILVA